MAKAFEADLEHMIDYNNHPVNRTQSDEDSEHTDERNKIMCNGKCVYVKHNLYRALLQLRKRKPGLYWIDAICINQSDLSERDQQVQMMDQIYSGASQVTVWLGDCPLVFHQGVANLLEMTKAGLPDISEAAEPKELYYSRAGKTSVWHLMLCVIFIVTRKWFRRLWVLQELCLAKHAIFILGDHQLTVDDMSAAFCWMRSTLDAWNMDKDMNRVRMFTPFVELLGDGPDQAVSLLSSRKTISQGQKVGLEEWFRLVRNREAGDPRDMVYGGLALVKSETLLMNPRLKDRSEESTPTLPPRPGTQAQDLGDSSSSGTWPILHANYGIDLQALLERVAVCLLSRPNQMNLLSLATRRRYPYFYDLCREANYSFSLIKVKDELEMVSQIPSWYTIPWLGSSRVMKPLIWQSGVSLEFISETTNNPSISADGKSLFLDATKLDTIESCVFSNALDQLAHSTESVIFGSPSPFYLLELAIKIAPGPLSETEPYLEAFCDLLIAGSWKNSGTEKDAAKDKMIGFCQWLHDLVKEILKRHTEVKAEAENHRRYAARQRRYQKREKIMTKIEANYSLLKSIYPAQPWSSEGDTKPSEKRKTLATRFARKLQIAQTGRDLFETRNGALVLAPAWSEKGDVVMGVKGGRVPYVLTPRDEDLQRKIAYKKKLESKIPTEFPEEEGPGYQEAKAWNIEDLYNEIGKKDCYILTGESYLYHMSRRKISWEMLDFQRIEIV